MLIKVKKRLFMQRLIEQVVEQVNSIVIGKEQQVKLAMACLLAKGHLLIEDLPGMGKTTLAHVLSVSLGLSYQRVQFTSDLLPSDVIGVSIFDQNSGSFTLHKGPIFNQVVLADEINRASPKTQSALLEAMEGSQISVDGETLALPEPFFVIATQNPMFHAGTYPLPESQLDRFMMRISLGFPDIAAEKKILLSSGELDVVAQLQPALQLAELQTIQAQVTKVYVAEAILEYIIALFQLTRTGDGSMNALSPRAGKALVAAAKAWAYIEGRDHVLPDDIKSVFSAVCEHRIASTSALVGDDELISYQLLKKVDSAEPFA